MIMVPDMARARSFYEGKLGLEVVRQAGPYLFLRAGASQLLASARAKKHTATHPISILP
jgi:catechol 2,3-dioxygenase-like lactoylglutathione lyase family enzyme